MFSKEFYLYFSVGTSWAYQDKKTGEYYVALKLPKINSHYNHLERETLEAIIAELSIKSGSNFGFKDVHEKKNDIFYFTNIPCNYLGEIISKERQEYILKDFNVKEFDDALAYNEYASEKEKEIITGMTKSINPKYTKKELKTKSSFKL